ncbi:zinc dependent phospholipase C family protein [Treponema primitia]|uniref:zinc dependent phospholipase C family protein n=1 Tax=Treponema primitia TaxID=88058 RepID=UPI0039801EFF
MPSQILHTLFGEDVIAGMFRVLYPEFGVVAKRAREKVEEDYRFSFVLGCQGPDIFYHNQMTRPVGLEYGTLLHRRFSGTFTAALLKLGLPDPPASAEDVAAHRPEGGITALGAYALGFMTHAILDRACHPYIVYKTAKLSGESRGTERNIHAFFERVLDVLMLEELRGGKPVASWDQDSLAQICENPPRGLKELLAKSLRHAFPERALKDQKLSQRMDNTFRDCAGFYRYTDPGRTSLQSPLAKQILEEMPLVYIYPEELPGDVDYLNKEHRAWYYPAGDSPAETRSFPEIYAQALAFAVEILTPLIAKYLATGIFPIVEAARSIGNGGLSIQDAAGKPCSPSRSEPLPLESVLEQQRRLRLV